MEELKMKIYKVSVMEVYRKVVSIQANNEREAYQRACDAWQNTEIILNEDNFDGVEISVLSEADEAEKFIKGYDYGKGTAKNGK